MQTHTFALVSTTAAQTEVQDTFQPSLRNKGPLAVAAGVAATVLIDRQSSADLLSLLSRQYLAAPLRLFRLGPWHTSRRTPGAEAPGHSITQQSALTV